MLQQENIMINNVIIITIIQEDNLAETKTKTNLSLSISFFIVFHRLTV